MARQTFDDSVGVSGNPLTIGGYVYALRTNAGATTGTLNVQRELLGDAVLDLNATGGYLSIAQASGTAFNLNSLVIDRDISVLGNTFFVGYRNGVQVISQAVGNLLSIGDQAISFGTQWQNLTEVRVFARDVLDVNIGVGFAIDDVVTTDVTAPLAPTLSAGTAATADNTPTLIGTAEIGATVTIFNGTTALGTATAGANGAYSFTPVLPLADGRYSLTARATDLSGNVGPASATVALQIDATAPGAPAFTAGGGLTNDTTPTVTGRAEAGSTVTIYNGTVALGTTAAAADGTFSFTPATALGQGSYGLTATARDALGNVSPVSTALAVTIDSVAPGAPTAVAPSLTNDATPTITGIAEAGSTVTLFNGTTALGSAVAAANGTYSVTPTADLAAGTYSLSVTATDTAGNVSARSAAATTVIDLTAPLAPTLNAGTAATADNTPTLTGTAEAGATVTIFNGTTALGTATAGANGAYSFTPTVPLADGSYSLTAVARDAAGNLGTASAPVALAIDTVAPAVPLFTAGGGLTSDPTPTLTGRAEPGSTVTILNGTAVLGTALAGADGNFSFTPADDLNQGSYTLTAIARDPLGNASPVSADLALTLDLTAPGAPVLAPLGATNDPTPTITGTAEAGATVTIVNGTTILGTVVAGANGAFSVTPDADLPAGTLNLTATARDPAGNVSVPSATLALTIDTQAPAAPVLAALGPTNDPTPTISGTAEAGATVTILDGTTILGTAVAGMDGAFSVTPDTDLPAGTLNLTATARDPAGNVSVPSAALALTIDTQAPAAPVLAALGPTNDPTPTITGTAEAGATVTILDGTTVLGTAVAGPDGTFSFTAPALPAGTATLTATALDAAGNISAPAAVTFAIDTTAPSAPVITTLPGTVADSTPTITGTAEVGAVVTLLNGTAVLGSAVADAGGVFAITPALPLPDGPLALTATARDAAGNLSPASGGLALTIDTSVPGAPDLAYDSPTNDARPVISGTAEAGATITIAGGGTTFGTGTADANGTFSITLEQPLSEGNNALTVTATSPAGIISPAAPLNVLLDTLAPPEPEITGVPSLTNDPAPTIFGTAEAGTTVTILDGSAILGTTTADANGAFAFTPTAPLADGIATLTARALDAAGNLSAASVSVDIRVDTAAPLTPDIDPLPVLTNDATPTVTGRAEAGSTVTLLSGGAIVGTAVADGDGLYAITPGLALADGPASLSVSARDAAGNVSGSTEPVRVVIDTLAPAAPTLADLPAAIASATPVITGTADPNAVVTITNGGTLLGMTTAGAGGTFTFTPTSPLPDGTATLTATVQDAAGNVSPASAAVTVVIDTTAPAAPVITTQAGTTTDNTPVIAGTAEPGTSVTVRDDGALLGTVTADGAGNWSLTPGTALGDGPNLITATAADAAGNTSAPAAGITLTVDTGAPAAPALTSAGGALADNTPTITGTAEPGATVTIRNGDAVIGTVAADAGGNFAFTPDAPLGDGSYSLIATATDAAGLTSTPSQPLALTIDTAAPGIPTVTGGGGATQSTTPVLTGTGEPGTTVTLLEGTTPVGSATVGTDGTFSVAPTNPLAEGAHDLVLQLTDAAGNVGAPSVPVGVVVDTQIDVPPAVAFTVAATADGTINAAEAVATAFTVAGLDAGTAATATFSDGTRTVTVPLGVDGTYAANLTGLNGPVTTSLRLADAAGNALTLAGPALNLDTLAPAGTAVADTAGGPEVASFTFAVNFPEAVANLGADDFVLTGSGGASGTVTNVSGAGGSYVVTVAGITGSGALTLALSPDSDIADLAGNLATLAPAVRDVTGVPPVQPVITGYADDTGVPSDGITADTTPTLTGIGAPGATVTLAAAIGTGTVTATGTVAADGTWSVTLPTLADGAYSITASLAGDDGRPIGTSAPFALTIDTTVDTGPAAALAVDATADGVVNGPEASAVTFTVTGLDAGTGGTVTFADSVRSTSVVVGADGAYTVDLTGFNGSVTSTLALRDAAGNTATVAGDTLTLATGQPGTPVIAGFADDTGTPGDALTSDATPTVSGAADPGTTIRLTVGTPEGPVSVETRAGGDGAWSATLPALADGAYAVTAVALDAAGNASTASVPFPIIIDATAPAGTATADLSGGTAAQSFTVALDFPETVVNVSPDDFVLTGTNGASGTVTEVLGTGGSYTVTVANVTGTGTLTLGLAAGADIADAAGNLASLAASSRPVAVSPSAAPPTITGFSDDSGTLGDGITNDATPTLTGTGIAGGTVTVRYDGAPGSAPLTGPVDAQGNWTLTAPTLADGTYVFSVTTTSADGAVASGTADALRLTIDTVADALPAVALAVDGTADGVLTPGEAATVQFTLSGLDAGSTAVVSFTDGTRTVTAQAAADGTYTADLSVLSGSVTSTVAVTDAAGNAASAAGNAVLVGAGSPGGGTGGDGGTGGGDGGTGGGVTPPGGVGEGGTPPAIPVIGGIRDDTGTPGDGLTGDSAPTVVGTGTPGSTVTISYADAAGPQTATGTVGQDGTWQVGLPALADGSYSLVATANAGAGTGSAPSQPLQITIDTSAPAAPVLDGVSGADGSGTVGDSSPSLTGTAEAGSTVEVRLDTPTGPAFVNGITGPDGRWTVDLPTLADGSYTVTVDAVDAAGNRGTASAPVAIVVDTTPGGGAGGDPGDGTGGGVVTPPGGGIGEGGGTPPGAAPVLTADADRTFTHAPAISGNLLANDAGSGLHVTAVRFADGLTVQVPNEGAARVVGDFGTLTVAADGSYSYQAIGANNLPIGYGSREHFTYTATDAAGRTGETALDIQLEGQAPQASASFDFAFTEAKVGLAGEALVLVGPDGIVRDISGIDTLHFTDGEIQNNDGNRVVDDVYYYARNLDVWQAHVDADLHYAVFGWHEGRDPNAYFQTSRYLAENPDVAAAGVNPLEHYLTSGEHEGRSPSPDFSAEAYLRSNPDVAEQDAGALAHYFAFGRAEGRTVFAGESDGPNRAIGSFDAGFYLAQNPDVAATVPTGVTPESYALQHYLNYGAAEQRDPNALFDTAYYLAQNPDVAATGANPLLHYQETGWHEGRNPSAAFDTDAYLARYPDVAQANIDPLAHYIQYGMHEGRLATA